MMNSVSNSAVETWLAPLPVLRDRALRELLKAYRCAYELGHPPWEFAVTIRELRGLGLSETDVRWLVRKGYLEHRLEVMQPEHAQRRFSQIANLGLTERSCFVLTAPGVEYAGEAALAPGQAAVLDRRVGEVPRWDAEVHALYWCGQAIKCFKEEAPCQEAVLDAFQAAGWADCVEVLLPRDGEADAKQRLRDAVRNLNRSVRPQLHFRQEGCGSRVRWEARG
jgi:hypothetical protein